MGVCNCSMFCCTLLCVRSSIAIILMGKRELVALLNLSSWCLVMVERLFLAVPQGCLRFVIVVFPDHTHLLFFTKVNRLFIFFQLFQTITMLAIEKLIVHLGKFVTIRESYHAGVYIRSITCSTMYQKVPFC